MRREPWLGDLGIPCHREESANDISPLVACLPFPGSQWKRGRQDRLPEGEGWWFEPKWDGFRSCIAIREDDQVTLQAKSGQAAGSRYFPEVVERLRTLSADPFIVDGELLVEVEGRLVVLRRCRCGFIPSGLCIAPPRGGETPASLTLFDMLLKPDGVDLRGLPLTERRQALAAFRDSLPDARALWVTDGTADRALAQGWLDSGRLEGVVAKRWDGPYLEGERAMVKVKRIRTADCVVGGFRYETGGQRVGSLLLGLYNDRGLLDHVGFTSGIATAEKAALTEQLEGLVGEPGFTGDKPGGPSRWATERSAEWTPLRPELVVEVSFDHVTGGRFRHGTRLLRFRPDKAPQQCGMDQIRQV